MSQHPLPAAVPARTGEPAPDGAAPRHAPTFAAATLGQRLAPWWPLLLVPALMLLGLAAIGTVPTWATLTLAGLAMGMMIFLIASGMTLIFGLMDVINFGHGAFIAIGAFTGASALAALPHLAGAGGLGANLAAVGAAVLAAVVVTGLLGWGFERVIVRPVYGAHLKQILVTTGGLIVAEQMIFVIWGGQEIHVPRPETLKGALLLGGAVLEKYRLLAVAVGLALFLALRLVLRRSRLGLIVRAGVENPEMVQALGYRITRVFVAVFIFERTETNFFGHFTE